MNIVNLLAMMILDFNRFLWILVDFESYFPFFADRALNASEIMRISRCNDLASALASSKLFMLWFGIL